MKVTMLLADHAQHHNGKLFIAGGGWSVIGPEPSPTAIAIKLEIEGTESDRPHHWELFLEDADGHLVQFGTPEGIQSLEVRGDIPSAAELDMAPGSIIEVPLAFNFPPLPLEPGARYMWRMVIDGESLPGATASFATLAAPVAP